MENCRKHLFFVFFWLGVSLLLWPGIVWSDPLSFEHLTVDEGLPDNTIRAILQDREGYLWIGSHAGLIRYDGYEMRVFVPDPADSNSIGCRLINSLFLDSRGNLWIGSLANGVARYSPQTESFKNFAPRQLASDGTLPGSVVVQMAETRDGSILVHFDDTTTLARIDRETLKVQVIPPPPDTSAALQGLHVDEQGLLWQGLDGQGVIVRAPGGVVVQEIGIRKGLEVPNIFQIKPAGAGRMWFLGLNTLSLYDQRTRQLDTFAPSDWGHSTRLRFMAMESDGEGGLWIGADAGLYHFSQADETFTLIKHDPGRHDALANGPVVSLCRDRSGILWIGTWHAGLDKLDPQARKFSTFEAGESGDKATLPIASVSSILVDGRKNLWVGTGSLSHSGPIGGLARLDAATNSFRSLEFPENSVRTVMNIAATHPDSLWLGTNAGLWLCLARQDSIFRPPVRGPGLESLLGDPIRSLTVDSQGVYKGFPSACAHLIRAPLGKLVGAQLAAWKAGKPPDAVALSKPERLADDELVALVAELLAEAWRHDRRLTSGVMLEVARQTALLSSGRVDEWGNSADMLGVARLASELSGMDTAARAEGYRAIVWAVSARLSAAWALAAQIDHTIAPTRFFQAMIANKLVFTHPAGSLDSAENLRADRQGPRWGRRHRRGAPLQRLPHRQSRAGQGAGRRRRRHLPLDP